MRFANDVEFASILLILRLIGRQLRGLGPSLLVLCKEPDRRPREEVWGLAWHSSTPFVGLAYCVVVLVINTVVDSLYVVLNPKLRVR